MKIFEYIGPKNNQNIEYGNPFLVIGFCGGEWELSKVTWHDVNNDHPAIQYKHDNLMVELSVNPEQFEKYFRFSCEILS